MVLHLDEQSEQVQYGLGGPHENSIDRLPAHIGDWQLPLLSCIHRIFSMRKWSAL